MKAAFCGTFDPVTMGHLNLIERAARLFEEVVVIVSPNSDKHNRFSEAQRVAWLQEAVAPIGNVRCEVRGGLAVEAAAQAGCQTLVRGVRSAVDLAYEQNMAEVNRYLDPHLETVVLLCDPAYAYYSSSNVRELLKYGQDISPFVPACVSETLKGEKHV